MERFFRFRDRWGNGAALWVVMLMFFSLPFIWIGVRQLHLENDVTSWLPEDDPDARILHWFQDQFEHEERMLVSWDSSVLGDPRVDELVSRLTGTDGYTAVQGVADVTTPQVVLSKMTNNHIDEKTAVDRVTGVLIGSGFLKIQLSEHGANDPTLVQSRIATALAGRVDNLSVLPAVIVPERDGSVPIDGTESNSEPSEETDEDDADEDETDDDDEVEEFFVASIPDHDFQLRWKEISPFDAKSEEIINTIKGIENQGQPLITDAFFAAGAPIAVSVSLNEFGEEHVRETVDAVFETMVAAGIPGEEIHMGGSPIGRNRLNREAQRSLYNPDYPLWNVYKSSPIAISTALGIILSFVMLRSFRLGTLVLLTSVFTVAVVISLIPATGRQLNMVLIVLPNLLLVLTTSGTIHVANYWKHAVADGEEHPIAHAVGTAWQPCLLASVTTAIGMGSLMSAVLGPVREFGFYSSIGCLISLVMILIGFPSMMSLWPEKRQTAIQDTAREEQIWGKLSDLIMRFHVPVCIACLGLFAFSIFGLNYFKTETKVIRYFPSHSRIIKDYDFLEEGLSGLVSIDAVIRFDQADRDDGLNVLDRMELVREVEAKIAKHRWISGTLSLADFQPIAPTLEEGASRLDKIKYRRRVQRTEDEIFEKQSASTQQFTRLTSETLNLSHQNRHVEIEQNDEVWRIRAQAVVMGDVDYDTLTRELNEIVQSSVENKPGADYVVTGLVPLFLRTQNAVLESLIFSFGLAFGIIAVVMIVLLKNPVSGMLAMLPNLFPVGVVFGLVSWAGIPVDIGTMITASVALGIAVDGTLHLLTWFQESMRSGLNRKAAINKALRHCGPAMWQTSASIAVAMVMLSGADLLLICRFGWLMGALILMALVADVVLLPALLAGWLGALIARANGIDESKLHAESDGEISVLTFPTVESNDSKPSGPGTQANAK